MGYRRFVGPKLKDLLTQVAEEPDQRASLSEEVDLSRVLALEYVRSYEKVIAAEEKGETIPAEVKALAIEGMKQALGFVKEMVVSFAKVRSLSDATMDVEVAGHLVEELRRIIDDVLSDHPDLYKKVCSRLDEVKLKRAASPQIVIQ